LYSAACFEEINFWHQYVVLLLMAYFVRGMGQKAGKNLRKSDIKRAVPAKMEHFTVFI
jgi:hypothetical protein